MNFSYLRHCKLQKVQKMHLQWQCICYLENKSVCIMVNKAFSNIKLFPSYSLSFYTSSLHFLFLRTVFLSLYVYFSTFSLRNHSFYSSTFLSFYTYPLMCFLFLFNYQFALGYFIKFF